MASSWQLKVRKFLSNNTLTIIPIYYEKENQIYLNPKYIVGVAPRNSGELNEFIFNELIDKNIKNYPTYYDENIMNLINQKKH